MTLPSGSIRMEAPSIPGQREDCPRERVTEEPWAGVIGHAGNTDSSILAVVAKFARMCPLEFVVADKLKSSIETVQVAGRIMGYPHGIDEGKIFGANQIPSADLDRVDIELRRHLLK